MKTCKDCYNFSICREPYTDKEIIQYTTGDITNLCTIFKDKRNYVEVIRCGECRQYIRKGGRCWKLGFNCSVDDYCSQAERVVYRG